MVCDCECESVQGLKGLFDPPAERKPPWGELKTRILEPEPRNSKPETRNHAPETRTPKQEAKFVDHETTRPAGRGAPWGSPETRNTNPLSQNLDLTSYTLNFQRGTLIPRCVTRNPKPET